MTEKAHTEWPDVPSLRPSVKVVKRYALHPVKLGGIAVSQKACYPERKSKAGTNLP